MGAEKSGKKEKKDAEVVGAKWPAFFRCHRSRAPGVEIGEERRIISS